jgi:hypothetical protein
MKIFKSVSLFIFIGFLTGCSSSPITNPDTTPIEAQYVQTVSYLIDSGSETTLALEHHHTRQITQLPSANIEKSFDIDSGNNKTIVITDEELGLPGTMRLEIDLTF